MITFEINVNKLEYKIIRFSSISGNTEYHQCNWNEITALNGCSNSKQKLATKLSPLINQSVTQFLFNAKAKQIDIYNEWN